MDAVKIIAVGPKSLAKLFLLAFFVTLFLATQGLAQAAAGDAAEKDPKISTSVFNALFGDEGEAEKPAEDKAADDKAEAPKDAPAAAQAEPAAPAAQADEPQIPDLPAAPDTPAAAAAPEAVPPAVPVTPADPPAVPVTPAVAPGADSPAVPVTPAALTEDKPAACQEMPSRKSPFRVDKSKAGGAICGQPAPEAATGAAADKPADAAGTQTATVAVTPPAAKPPTREEVMALLRADPPIDTPRLEQALGLLENNPGSEDDVFLLVRVLSKRDPKYKIRLGAFFDPTDGRGKGEVIPNVKYAYDEYNDSGLPEAKELIARLVTWSKTAEAANADGLEEFKAAIN